MARAYVEKSTKRKNTGQIIILFNRGKEWWVDLIKNSAKSTEYDENLQHHLRLIEEFDTVGHT